MRQHALIGIIIAVAAQAQAAPVALNEDELRTAVVGKTVNIDTPLGTPLTVQIAANGMMHGTATGALALYLGSGKDRGRWRVKDGRLCQKWFKWLDAEESCIAIKQDGLKIFWRREDGKTGTAMIEPGPPVLAGATASGLGLPPPPAEPEAQSPETAVSPTSTQPIAAVVRPQPVPVAPRAAPVAVAPLRPPVEAPAEPPDVTAATAGDPAEPQLIETPRVAARRTQDHVRLAAFSPHRPVAPPVEAAPSEGTTDPFDAEVQPMRWAADLHAIAAMEHRWCLADAFGRGPAPPPGATEAIASARLELEAVPNLLAVFYETSYPGELPLHEAACLTAEPALLHRPIAPIIVR